MASLLELDKTLAEGLCGSRDVHHNFSAPFTGGTQIHHFVMAITPSAHLL
jgi:hypothetical protein